jgi:dihydroneopterin aldolase
VTGKRADRIVLSNMTFAGLHGVLDEERTNPKPFEVDVELRLDLRPAGLTDDLGRSVDYREIFEICRSVIEGPSLRLIESLAESIAAKVLAAAADRGPVEVVVRVRKPQVTLPGSLDYAGVEIRRRSGPDRG